LDYVNFTKTLVIINGDDPDQVAWFSHSDYSKDIKTMLLLTDGSYYDLTKKLERPVFYATGDIIRQFQLEAVPSIVHQKGKYMEVEEVALPKTKTYKNHQ
jgi:conjugal transfer pilus assembly protein TraW